MAVILTSSLNSSQKIQIQSIVDASAAFEPVTISFPLEEADFYALFEPDGIIRSAATFTKEDAETYECCACTAPGFRCQGMFSALLDAAIEILPEDCQFLFYTDHKSPDTLAALSAFAAEPVMQEYMMELDPELSAGVLPDGTELCMNESVQDGTRTYHYETPFGSVRISVFSSYYYLYGFEILEEHRGKGHGNCFLEQVLHDLAERKLMPVRLQVSGDNVPALNLYKKTGFRITETLSCYLY